MEHFKGSLLVSLVVLFSLCYVTQSSTPESTVCAITEEFETMVLSCASSYKISHIEFASFGNPKGTCGDFRIGSCDSVQAFSIVQGTCLGRQSCSIPVSQYMLGEAKCDKSVTTRRLSVQVTCK